MPSNTVMVRGLAPHLSENDVSHEWGCFVGKRICDF
jgi:hypothetical protein